jgi:hypothetical protein
MPLTDGGLGHDPEPGRWVSEEDSEGPDRAAGAFLAGKVSRAYCHAWMSGLTIGYSRLSPAPPWMRPPGTNFACPSA